jgi:16S rRNA (cytosine967-C5)-methyltransferase
MKGEGRLIACDSDRGRLAAMQRRLTRAAAMAEVRLLNPGREMEKLSDLGGQADCVLVDAPCSGTGTWRRNPELRWRLDAVRLDRLLAIQARLIDLGASLLKPGGRLIYAVCSVLEGEGALQADAAIAHLGLVDRARRGFTPLTDGCDGFFVARLDTRC